MREKYESLALVDLKAIARTRGIKGTSLMKKMEVVNAMLELDEKEKLLKQRENVLNAQIQEFAASTVTPSTALTSDPVTNCPAGLGM